MRAIVIDAYGPPDVLKLVDVPKPTPGDNELLVRVRAVAVTVADARIRGARFPNGFAPFARLAFGVLRPRVRILGNTFSGTVEAVGAGVTEFAPGDEVCGMTGSAMGTYAEYITVQSSKAVTMKPATVSHEDAAGVLFGGTTAYYFLRDRAALRAGQSIVINGASGAVGTNAVQLARHFGADVTAVTSAGNAGLVKDLGAAQVFDYRQQPLAGSGRTFDVVFDAVGNISIADGLPLLNPGGKLLLVVADLMSTIRARGAIMAGSAPERSEDMAALLSLVESGELRVVIDQVYDSSEVAAAHARVDTGHKIGNIVLRM